MIAITIRNSIENKHADVRVSRGSHNFLPQSCTLDKVFHSRVQCIPWESEANVSRSQSADKKNNISNTNEGGIKSPWFMDVKITMQVDCWKRCYCGLTLTANDKGCIPSIQHRWTMAPYHATRFFFQFPELIVGFMSTLRPFLAIARTMEPLFQGGGFAELSIREQTLKRARPEKWQRLLDYYLAW